MTDKSSAKAKKPQGKTTQQNKKKATTRKRSKVVVPKMTNLYKPAGMTLQEWQIALRQQQAEKETFSISQVDEQFAAGEYRVYNATTRNDYKVTYRGAESTWNYCSCYDFKTSQLGTCKHLEAVKLWVKDKHKRICRKEPGYSSVYIDYKGPRRVKIRFGEDCREALMQLAKDYFDDNGVMRKSAYAKFDVFMQAAKAISADFRCYDDALDFIIEQREKQQREKMMDKKYTDNVLDQILTAHLYPYQKEGIRFAVKAGKAIIADEMGLGKTIQAIASAEIFLREGLAESVLIVCPTSLKYQWKKEIEKFTGGDTVDGDGNMPMPKVVVIEGNPPKRAELYRSRIPYKIVSYHAMLNDVRLHGQLVADVLIMDEIQRLKNWDTLISKAARKIISSYAVLLSGTPLENKLEELYANMELVDQFCLGPYYLFRNKHILIDPDKGSVIGYQNLNAVGEQISDRLIRRTKKGVQLQLPKRSDQFILMPMTTQQADYHASFKWELTILINKYQKFHYMSEADRRKMMKLLAQMRMVADSTFILEQDLKTRHDMKIAEVMNLLDNVFENGDEKVVIFSEWERMTRLVAMELEKRHIRYEYLCGNVPSKQRGELVENFTTLPESRVFLSTDAGSTGLNLQAASVLINLDLPWNPAVLEQRIARIYRLGQERPVQVLNLVSKSSIEEGMIGKLQFKTSMFEGVLDGGDDTVFISEDKFKKFMEDISCVMKETTETPTVELVDEEPEPEATTAYDEGQPIGNSPETADDVAEPKATAAPNSCPQDPLPPQPHTPHAQPDTQHPSDMAHDPQQLINQGFSFLSGLAETLKSPEATKQLIDNIVDVNPATGETNIKIPIASKDTVAQVFSLFGKLLQR